LSGVSLDIKKGERIALLGANGSGKSTLLMVLAGLVFPGGGTTSFFGKEFNEDSFREASFQKRFRSNVGIVFQNSDIQLFNSNVEDEILFGLFQLGLPDEVRRLRLDKYKALMDISHLTGRHPQYMSAGEKKRLALASVLAMEPEVLLLDEPTAGLDPRTTRHFIDTIYASNSRQRTIITSTQDIHIVPEIADRVIVLSERKSIAKDGDVHTVLNDRTLLEAHNLIHAHVHEHKGLTHVHPHEHPDHHHEHGGGA
jgi:cobalt/nickel transport system ATP-binding protein